MANNDLFNEKGDYVYKSLDLTPNIASRIVQHFYTGKTFRRQEAMNFVMDFHKNNGGVLKSKRYDATIKSAINKLKDYVVNKEYGIWYLSEEKVNEADKAVVKKERVKPADAPVIDDDALKPDKVIGFGKKSVYLYYYEAYKQLAFLKGNSSWACKIGRSDADPISRVFGQAGTCYPEIPHIALVIYCDNSSIIEDTIHNILKLRDRWMKDAPGTEWFITSPEEDAKIYKRFLL